LLVFAAKNTFFQKRVMKTALKTYLQGRTTAPPTSGKFFPARQKIRRFEFESISYVSRYFFAICISVNFDHAI